MQALESKEGREFCLVEKELVQVLTLLVQEEQEDSGG